VVDNSAERISGLDLSGLAPGSFSPGEMDLLQSQHPADLNPEERGKRLTLLLRPIRYAGSSVETVLLAQYGARRQANLLIRVLSSVARKQVDFSGEGGFWRWGVDFVRTIITLEEPVTNVRFKEGEPMILELHDIFGGSADTWAGIDPNDYEAVMARLIQAYAPGLIDQIPTSVQQRALIRGASESGEGGTQEDIRRLLEEIRSLITSGKSPVTGPSPSAPPPKIEFNPNVKLPSFPGEETPEGAAPPEEEPKERTQLTLEGGVPAPPPPIPYLPAKAEQDLTEKYRPKTLRDVIGNVGVINRLRSLVGANPLPRCMVFIGPPGVGKTSTASAFARDHLVSVLARMGITQPLGPEWRRGYFYEVNAAVMKDNPTAFIASTILPVIRSISSYGPSVKRIIVFDDVANLSPSNQQLLLRPLEQFSRNVTTIWISNDPVKRIPALEDRCGGFTFHFTALTESDIRKGLERIAVGERWSYPTLSDDIAQAARESNRSLRRATDILYGLVLEHSQHGDNRQA